MPQDKYLNCVISKPIEWDEDWIVLHCPKQMQEVCLDGPSFDDNQIKFEGEPPLPGVYRCTITAHWSGIGAGPWGPAEYDLEMTVTELDLILSFEAE